MLLWRLLQFLWNFAALGWWQQQQQQQRWKWEIASWNKHSCAKITQLKWSNWNLPRKLATITLSISPLRRVEVCIEIIKMFLNKHEKKHYCLGLTMVFWQSLTSGIGWWNEMKMQLHPCRLNFPDKLLFCYHYLQPQVLRRARETNINVLGVVIPIQATIT